MSWSKMYIPFDPIILQQFILIIKSEKITAQEFYFPYLSPP